MDMQYTLFEEQDVDRHVAYWREQLNAWPGEVWRYRRDLHTTGWSMATQKYVFARLLWHEGQLTDAQLARYLRFNRAVRRRDGKHTNKVTK